jgi:hypothetical protein
MDIIIRKLKSHEIGKGRLIIYVYVS